MTRVTCTIYSTWCIMICLILSLLLFIQSLYSLSKLQFFPFTCITTVHPTFYLPPHFTSSPTTSLHLISHHFTSLHLISHPPPHLPPTNSLHLISHHLTSPHLPPLHLTSPHLPPTTSSPTHQLTSPHLPPPHFTSSPTSLLHSISHSPLHLPPTTPCTTPHLISHSPPHFTLSPPTSHPHLLPHFNLKNGMCVNQTCL